MAFKIFATLVTIFILASAAVRTQPECDETITTQRAIEIAISKISTRDSNLPKKSVFDSDEFLSGGTENTNSENGWIVSQYKDDYFDGYFVQFNFKNDKYGGLAHFNITKCGNVKSQQTGAWLIKSLKE